MKRISKIVLIGTITLLNLNASDLYDALKQDCEKKNIVVSYTMFNVPKNKINYFLDIAQIKAENRLCKTQGIFVKSESSFDSDYRRIDYKEKLRKNHSMAIETRTNCEFAVHPISQKYNKVDASVTATVKFNCNNKKTIMNLSDI
ncbi:MAG: hypothetical protein U9N59_03735 [Campylobacterota bacterium]|nr:hypothetical protein [Campylobacterota bacterium]